MIGTVHTDPLGRKTLEQALRQERPDVITVEASELLVKYVISGEHKDLSIRRLRRARQEGLSQLAFQNVSKQIRTIYNFEIEVSIKYAQQIRVPLVYVELPAVDKQEIYQLKEKLSKEVIAELNYLVNHDSENMDRSVKLYTDLELALVNKNFSQLIVNINFDSDRDEFTAGKIRGLALRYGGAKLVHIGGGAHLLDDRKGRTLYERLKDLNPTRRTLRSYLK